MKDFEYKKEKKTFLLIINDEYLRINTLLDDLKTEYFNREHLIAYFLNKKLTSKANLEIIFSSNNQIETIHENT